MGCGGSKEEAPPDAKSLQRRRSSVVRKERVYKEDGAPLVLPRNVRVMMLHRNADGRGDTEHWHGVMPNQLAEVIHEMDAQDLFSEFASALLKCKDYTWNTQQAAQVVCNFKPRFESKGAEIKFGAATWQTLAEDDPNMNFIPCSACWVEFKIDESQPIKDDQVAG